MTAPHDVPLVSVIMPTFNRAGRIGAALTSIRVQTYANWEAIVVDDGSTDDTVNVVSRIAAEDDRIRFVRYAPNRGAQRARNVGIRAAHGDWVAFLDSDDEWLPESLEWRMAIARAEDVPVVHSRAYVIFDGRPRETYQLPAWRGMIYKDVLSREGPMFQTLLVKKQLLEQVGYLDERVVAFQEWDLSINLARRWAFGFEPRPTFTYDFDSNDGISRNALRAARGYAYIVRKHAWAILSHTGAVGMARHYDVLAGRFRVAGKGLSARRCDMVAAAWKGLATSALYRQARGLAGRLKSSR